jgi:hypothetical protein
MKKLRSYDESIHFEGRLLMGIAMVLILLIPVAISLYYDSWPQFGKLITPLLSVLSVYAPVAIIEVATYAPMMGAGGSYIGFITGNISSLKLPCALATLDANNVDISTEEGEVLSLLAISVSALVTTLVVALGVLLLATTSIGEFLKSPVLGPAFDNLLAALFGALGVVYVSKNFKIALPPLLLMILLFIVAPSLSVGVLIPIGAVFAVACARVMYKKGMLTKAVETEQTAVASEVEAE